MFNSTGNHTNKKYSRYQLQYIDKTKLIINESIRPKFDPTFTYRILPIQVHKTTTNNKVAVIQPITRSQTQQNIQTEKIEKLYTTIKLSNNNAIITTPKVLTPTNLNKNNLSPKQIIDINKKYGLHNFTIDVGIKTTKKK